MKFCVHQLKTLLALVLAFGFTMAAPAQVPKEVLAFYYGWYGNPNVSDHWLHWRGVDYVKQEIASSTNWPKLGPYDCHNPAIIDQHMAWAKEAGITGFIVTWWYQGDFHDKGLPLILKVAEKHGLKITVYYEVVKPRDDPAVVTAVADLVYLLRAYGKHPAWLKVNGKPVIFVYGRAVNQLKLDGWKEVVRRLKEEDL